MVHNNDVTWVFRRMLENALGLSTVIYELFIEYGRTPSKRELAAALTTTKEDGGNAAGESERVNIIANDTVLSAQKRQKKQVRRTDWRTE